MTTFNEFAEWLFPGDELPKRTRNARLPQEASDILDEVSCKTGVPKEWLEKSARLVLDGLAGARCLWFLHGARGKIDIELEHFELVPFNVRQDIDAIIGAEANRQYKLDDKVVYAADANWYDGTIREDIYHSYGPQASTKTPVKSRTVRLGKWLRKHGASPELLKAFETRQLPHFEWQISCHPYDVLTMSFNRPWTSCMRPGGAAELGPLTDMAAGSAVMFFYRPGADKPCGRIMLRPHVNTEWEDRKPMLGSAHVVYGVGPGEKGTRFGHDVTLLDETVMWKALEPLLEGTGVGYSGDLYLCDFGASELALSRNIYSDVDNEYCLQDDDSYNEAYENLVALEWPEAKLDLGDFAVRAGEVAETVSSSRDPERWQIREAAAAIAEAYSGDGTVADLDAAILNTKRGDIPKKEDYENFFMEGHEDEIDSMVLDILREMKDQRLNILETRVVVALSIPASVDVKSRYRARHDAERYLEDTRSDVYFADLSPTIFSAGPYIIEQINRLVESHTGKPYDVVGEAWFVLTRPDDDLGDGEQLMRGLKAAQDEDVELFEFTLPPGTVSWSNS